MAPLRQAVVLLLQCALIIYATEDESNRLSELNEQYKPQIFALLDYLNSDPYREFNYRIYKYVNSAQKTDEILDVEIEVGADCLNRNKCSRAVLVCRGYVEYFSDENSYKALPGAQCQVVWNDEGNATPETPNTNDEQEIPEQMMTSTKAPCYGCPNEINKNGEGVDSLLHLALDHVESERNKKHSIVEVVSLHRQIVNGVKFILVVRIAPTVCAVDASLINPELCPIDQNAFPEYCKIEFFQKPTFSTDEHIIANNCTRSQEFSPVKASNNHDNEIAGNQMNKNTGGITPERIADIEAQIIPTDPSHVVPNVETTNSVIDNSQLGVEDIPSLQSSTVGVVQNSDNGDYGDYEYAIKVQNNDDLQQRQTGWFSHEDEALPLIFPEKLFDENIRIRRENPPPKSSESDESSEEAAKKAQAAVEETGAETPQHNVKRQAPPQSSESSEETKPETAQPAKRQTPPQSSESSEEVKPKAAQPVKRQAPPQSSESSEEAKPEAAQPVKRQAPPQSSESSEEAKPETAQPVKRQAPPQSSESSEETKPETAQPVKREVPPQSSESSEETKPETAQSVKREVSPQSSESSEEAKPVKRQAPPQSSESSEEVKPESAQPVKRQAPPQSSESSEEAKPNIAQPVKRQAPPQSSESSEEVKPKSAQPVKRQAPPQSSESSEETKPETAQPVKRQAPPQSSESSEETKPDNSQKVKRQAPPQSSESSEEAKQQPIERVKRGAKDSSSSSSSSSDEDNNNNNKNGDDDDNNGKKHKGKENNDDDDNGKDKKRKGKHDDDDNDNGKQKNGNGNGNGDDSSSSSSSSDEDNNGNDNGKNRRRRSADSSSSSSDDNKNDDSSSSSDEDDAARDKRELIKPASEEKMVVRKVAEFAAKSLDDVTYEHKLLKIESVKKLAYEGTIYHIRMRVAVMKCNTVCAADGQMFCKVKVYVSPTGHMEVNKSHCHKIISQYDKNRTDRFFEGDDDEVDALNDENVKELINLGLNKLNKDAPEETRFEVATLSEATKRMIHVSTLIMYRVKVKVVLTDCLAKKSSEFCGVLGNTEKTCEFVAPFENGKFDELMYVKCDTRTKRQIPGGVSDARLDPKVIDLTKSSFLLADSKSPHDNKFKVLEILKATKQVVAGMKYKIKAKVAISDCPKNDQREPEECGQLEAVAPKLCDVIIWDQPWLGEKGRGTTVKCGDDVYDFPKDRVVKRSIKGAPRESNPDEIKTLLSSTLLELDSRTPHENKYKILRVVNSTSQLVSGMLHKITAVLALSDCAKTETKSYEECGMLNNAVPEICNIEIWDQPWLENGRKTEINCPSEEYTFTTSSKKLAKRSGLGGASEAKKDLINEMLSATMIELDTRTPHANKYKVVKVLEATQQTVSGFIFRITAEMALSNCLKSDSKKYHECGLLAGAQPEVCEIEIIDQSWLPNGKKTTINCPSESYNFETDSHPMDKRSIPGGRSEVEPDVANSLMRETVLQLDPHTPHENKYKVVNVVKATQQVVQGMKYEIQANLILSDCKKGDAQEAHECGELKSSAPKLCKVEIWDRPWLPNGRQTTLDCDKEHYSFTSGHKVAKRETLVGAPRESNPDEIKTLLSSTLLELDTRTPHKNKYKILRVLNSTSQLVSGTLHKITAEMALSDCAKTETKSYEECGLLSNSIPEICNIEIWDQPWLNNGRNTKIKCPSEKYTFKTNSKKLAKRSGFGAPTEAKDDLINELLSTTMVELDTRTPHANKYKVVKVIQATKQTVSGFLYKITAEMALSDCLKSDSKQYHECGLLADAKPEVCKIDIIDQSWLPNGRKTTIKCPSQTYNFATDSPKKIAKRAVLVGAPIENKEEVKSLLSTTMVELDAQTTHTNKYKVVSVLKSTKQLVSGTLYNITAELALSDCKKTENKESHQCGLLKDAEPEVCNIEIWDQPWLDNGKQTKVHCPSKKYEFTTDSKRRTKRHTLGSEVDSNDPLITDLTKSTLLYLDSRSTHDVKYKIQEIISARKQIVSGTKYYIRAKIILSDCKKYDSKDPVYCNEQKTATPRICDIKIWDQPWERHGRKTNITCDTESYQYRTGRSPNLLGQDSHDFLFSSFNKFIQEHKKEYKNKQEYEHRFKIFAANMKKVEILEKHEQGTAIYGATKFADLTEKEFKVYLGYKPELRAENEVPFADAEIPDIEIPQEFDWRKMNVVTEVKNQEQCGSCWAFSVTGNVEGQYALKYKKLLEFSEQELVDCDKMDDGCNGGLMDNAYRAIEKMGGLELESDYPYDAKDETCHFNRTMSRVQLSGAVNISHDETDMAKWLVKNGPISIALNANAMQFYMGGVSHPLKFLCNPESLDHGVLIVGYGVHRYPLFNRALPYWIVKNSWGTSWGEQGYYRVYRGDGTCGLNQTPSSAIVA